MVFVFNSTNQQSLDQERLEENHKGLSLLRRGKWQGILNFPTLDCFSQSQAPTTLISLYTFVIWFNQVKVNVSAAFWQDLPITLLFKKQLTLPHLYFENSRCVFNDEAMGNLTFGLNWRAKGPFRRAEKRFLCNNAQSRGIPILKANIKDFCVMLSLAGYLKEW